MNCLNRNSISVRHADQSGMTLVEVVIGIGLLSIMMVSFYAGFAYAFSEIRLSRENVRAAQILEEGMELARLWNWDQVANTPDYIPKSFKAPYYSDNPTNPPSGNFLYTVTVVVTNAPLTETYADDLKMITIQATWPSGKVTRKRQMTTFVSQYGLQKYVY